jgi:curved DNA-binding protein CbpA
MISKENPYKILNINKDASKSEIRRAYRSLVKEWHPDINPDDPVAEERFKEIQQAYDFLINEKTPSDQNTKNQWGSHFYSAMQDHPMQSLREMAVRYYADRGWFKNNPGKDHKK